MTKEDLLTLDGLIEEILPDGRFRVFLENGHRVIVYTAGKMRKYRIRTLVGDRVQVEMSPYDMDKGRLIYRERVASSGHIKERTAAMKDERPVEPPTAASPAPKRNPFRNKAARARLSPESVERQGRITLLAWNLLGGDAAIAFLNTYDQALGGRPLDLAIASAAGCEAVERAISARAGAD